MGSSNSKKNREDIVKKDYSDIADKIIDRQQYQNYFFEDEGKDGSRKEFLVSYHIAKLLFHLDVNFYDLTRKLPSPIILSPEMVDMVKNKEINEIHLATNDVPLAKVDIEKYSKQSIHDDNKFYPFRCDRYFDIYKLDTRYSEISVKGYFNGELKHTDIIKEQTDFDDKNWNKDKGRYDFILRYWNGNYNIISFIDGIGGFRVYYGPNNP